MKNSQFLKIILACTVVASCSHQETVVSSKNNVPTFATAPVQSMDPTNTITLPGELVSNFSTAVYPKTKGFVRYLNVDRGSTVHQGQVLAVLDAPEVGSEISANKANIQSIQSAFDESKAYYNRLLQTSKTLGAVSPHELEAARAQMMSDNAKVVAAKAELQSVNQKQNYLTVTAPFNGIITERNVSKGDLIGPDEASNAKPLFIIQDDHKLRLTVAIPELYANSLAPDQEVSFSVSSMPNQQFKARLARTSQSLDTHLRTLTAEFDFDNPKNIIKAGMYAEVKLMVKRSESTLYVPNTAVVNSTERLFVIKDDQGIAKWVDVRKGMTVGDKTEIFGDVKSGDKVIAQASDEIKDGSKFIERRKM